MDMNMNRADTEQPENAIKKAPSSGAEKNRSGKQALRLLCLLPLCLCFLTNSLVLQMAQLQRSADAMDDALPAPVAQYIHPAAAICLTAGYVLSLAVIAAAMLPHLREKH